MPSWTFLPSSMENYTLVPPRITQSSLILRISNNWTIHWISIKLQQPTVWNGYPNSIVFLNITNINQWVAGKHWTSTRCIHFRGRGPDRTTSWSSQTTFARYVLCFHSFREAHQIPGKVIIAYGTTNLPNGSPMAISIMPRFSPLSKTTVRHWWDAIRGKCELTENKVILDAYSCRSCTSASATQLLQC